MTTERFHQSAIQEILIARGEQLKNQKRYAASLAYGSESYSSQMAIVEQTRGDITAIKDASRLDVESGTFLTTVKGEIHGVQIIMAMDTAGKSQSSPEYSGSLDGRKLSGLEARALWLRYGRPAKAIQDRAIALQNIETRT